MAAVQVVASLAAALKPHQKEGVNFIWSNVVVDHLVRLLSTLLCNQSFPACSQLPRLT